MKRTFALSFLVTAQLAHAQGKPLASTDPLPSVSVAEVTGDAQITPGEYKIVFPEGFTPKKTKKGGLPWDGGGDPPDIIARLIYSDARGQKNLSSKKAQDSSALPAFEFGPITLDPKQTIRLFFIDSDALSDDIIDEYTISFSTKLEGGRRLTIPAKEQTETDVKISFEPVALAEEPAARKKLVQSTLKEFARVSASKSAAEAVFGPPQKCERKKVENIHVAGQYDDLETCEFDGAKMRFLSTPERTFAVELSMRNGKLVPDAAPLLGKTYQEVANILGLPSPKSTFGTGAIYCATVPVNRHESESVCVKVKFVQVEAGLLVDAVEYTVDLN